MKYCSRCGNELVDEAVVCTKCGCAVAPHYNPSPVATAAKAPCTTASESGKGGFGIVGVFGFVHTMLTVVATFCTLLGIILGHCYSSSYYYTYFYANEECMIPAAIFSFIGIGFATTCFVLTLVTKAGKKDLFASISRFVISLLSFVVAILALS